MIKKASYCLLTALMISVILFLITLISCSSENIIRVEEKDQNLNFEAKDLKIFEKSSQFGFELLEQINNKTTESKNIFVSPISVVLAFQILLNGAEGDTFNEIATSLNLGNSVDEINDSYKKLVKMLIDKNSQDDLILLNSIWYDDQFSVKESFLKVSKNVYDAEITRSDFQNPETLTRINDWIKNSTNGKIEKLLESIDPSVVMYIINSIYFNASWKYRFDPNKTTKMIFESDKADVETEFMYQKNKFNYYKDDLMNYVELPYRGDSLYSMVIMLPNENRSVGNILSEMDSEYWNYLLNHRKYKDGQIFLPKFKTDFKIKLKETLINLGIKKAFSSGADFTNVSDERIFVNEVYHKAAIEINEEGTEAAAVTAIEMIKMSMGSDFYFFANKPFLFAIKENYTNTILFIGKLVDP